MSATGPSRSFIASPDVYKVIAEAGDTRVILATWKPGQRDQWHSHPAETVVYALTDCDDLRVYFPSGQSIDGSLTAGRIEIQPAIQSHSHAHFGRQLAEPDAQSPGAVLGFARNQPPQVR